MEGHQVSICGVIQCEHMVPHTEVLKGKIFLDFGCSRSGLLPNGRSWHPFLSVYDISLVPKRTVFGWFFFVFCFYHFFHLFLRESISADYDVFKHHISFFESKNTCNSSDVHIILTNRIYNQCTFDVSIITVAQTLFHSGNSLKFQFWCAIR